jgi:hypothetical protein
MNLSEVRTVNIPPVYAKDAPQAKPKRPVMSMAEDAAKCNARMRRSWGENKMSNIERPLGPTNREFLAQRTARMRLDYEAEVLAVLKAQTEKLTGSQLSRLVTGMERHAMVHTLRRLATKGLVAGELGRMNCIFWWAV